MYMLKYILEYRYYEVHCSIKISIERKDIE
jgi:hypothetical protein